jgi:hypothetical protein
MRIAALFLGLANGPPYWARVYLLTLSGAMFVIGVVTLAGAKVATRLDNLANCCALPIVSQKPNHFRVVP